MQPLPVFYPRGYFPPVSNTERQREFRQRNPGYYGRLHAKRRAESKARPAAQAAVEQPGLSAPFATPAVPMKPLLMLPAPVQDPAMDALNALAASLKSGSAHREVLPVSTDQSRAA